MELNDLTLETLTRLRRDKRLTFEEIGALVGVSKSAVRRRAISLGLPHELFDVGLAGGARSGGQRTARFSEVRQRIAEVDDGSRTATQVAIEIGCNVGQVEWVRQRLGIRGRCRGVWDKERKSRLCSRCEMPTWEKNVILSDGLCLWCHIEMAGLSLAALVEELGWSRLLEAAG